MKKRRFLIVTVTYGDRFESLSEGPLRVSRENSIPILIVANGCDDPYLAELMNIERHCSDITVVFNRENKGSAGGFHDGLKAALSINWFDYVLVLDDDNYISRSDVDTLFTRYLDAANFCFRKGRKYQEAARCGCAPDNYIAEENSFLGFSIRRLIVKSFFRDGPVDLSEFDFPWAPYGGLLLSRQLLRSGILPDEQYFLYCDDTEFTYRVSKNYGLKFVPEVEVIDIDESWNVSSRGNIFNRILSESSDFRVFYSVRNQACFDKRRMKNSLTFYFNMSVFFLLIHVTAFLKHSHVKDRSRLHLIRQAIKNGLLNKLGKEKNF